MKTTLSALAIALLLAFSAATPAATAQRFATPEEAGTALVDALGTTQADAAKLEALFGSDWRTYIPEGDVDRADVDAFLAAYAKKHSYAADAAGHTQLSVGDEGWTLPLPLVQGDGGWAFDAAAGAQEMRVRRIGRNELAAVESARAYHDAQMDYAEADRDADGVLEYAQKFLSSDGQHDGLYWASADDADADISPLGPLFADVKPGDDWQGYHFRILDAQGPSAPGGAYSYRLGEDMSRGFALVAWPAEYGETGITSFMISHDGQVFEKDLGKDGAAFAEAMTLFDPDDSWKEVAADTTTDAAAATDPAPTQ